MQNPETQAVLKGQLKGQRENAQLAAQSLSLPVKLRELTMQNPKPIMNLVVSFGFSRRTPVAKFDITM